MKSLNQLKPDEVVALIKKKIREAKGDDVENLSAVYASHGYYLIHVAGSGKNRTLRRSRLPAFFKELKK